MCSTGLRVLVIEDEELSRKLVRILLELEGYEVWMASRADEGIEEARRRQPDLVIMDVGLPDLGGLEAMRLLRGDARTRDIPIVVLSGHASLEDKRAAMEAGCDAYLSKPIDKEGFPRAINGFLRRKNAERTSDTGGNPGGIDMRDIKEELAAKKERLKGLIKSRSKANCSSVVSSAMDVQRETEIEDLEEEIGELEKKVASPE
jgi:two-component system cell cycle response regulator DivK